jgi:PKD repeat protein
MDTNNNKNPIDISSEQFTTVDSNFVASAGFEAEAAKNLKVDGKPKVHNRLAIAAIGILAMVLIVVSSGLFLILSGGENNPLSVALGLNTAGLSGLIFIVLGLVFALVTFAGLIGGMVSVFKLMNTKKEDKPVRKRFTLFALISVLLVLVGLGGSIFSFSSINQVPGDVNSEFIETNPAITTGLTAPMSITFSAGNLGIDTDMYSIVSYNWSFGDGEVATGPTVTHTFQTKPAAGVYTTTLKVTYQEAGNVASELLTQEYTRVIGIENEQVFASFKFSPEQGQAPLRVSFDASESKDPDGQIIKYEWDFNMDGIFDTDGVKVTHTFEEVGSFTVVLKVTDNNGQTNTEEHIVVVKSDQIINAVINTLPNDQILTPTRAYQFDAAESASTEGAITGYEWNFGDGTTDTGRRVTHSYDKEGIYEITLRLTDEAGNKRTYNRNFTVSESSSGLFAKFSTLPANNNGLLKGSVPLRVSFDAGASSGANIVDYQWDFDNDGINDSSGQKTEYVFTKTGIFNPTLTITSVDDKAAKTSIKVEVSGSEFEARLSANPVNGIVPLTVSFDATATKLPEGEQVSAFRWDFGDGTPLLTDGPIVNHKFTSVGTFKVKVTGITATNKTADAEINVIVTATPLKACYTMSRKQGPAPLTVEFNPQCSTGTVSAYSWKFGSLGTSNDRRPKYTFNQKGTYEVELEVTDNGNNVSLFKDSVIVE